MPKRRSVITGVGLVSALGLGKDESMNALLSNEIGIDKVSSFDAENLKSRVSGEAPVVKMNQVVPKSHRKSVKLMSRDIQLAVMAADCAMQDSGLNTRANNPDGPIDIDPTRSGVNIGAGSMCCDLSELSQAASTSVTDGVFDLKTWGSGGMESLTPLWLLKYLPNMLSCHVSIIYDLQGPSNSITCGDTSGLMALGEARRHISSNKADIVLAGGAESKVNAMNFTRYALNNLSSSKYNDTPKESSRPFATDADGFVAAEGGAILVMEEYERATGRGAKIYAEVVGYGSSFNHGRSDNDFINPETNCKGTTVAIQKALKDAGIEAEDIDLLIPHGSGVPAHDKAEAAGIEAALGDAAATVPVLATKSRIGMAGAGSGAIDAAIAVLSMDRGVIAETLNCKSKAEGCSLNLTTGGKIEKEIKYALVTNYSLGGQTTAIVLKKHD